MDACWKPHTVSDDMRLSIAEFGSWVSKKSDRYVYVAAKERRGFNLIYRYWSGKDNLVTATGLLSRYKMIADKYQATQQFPKILLLDDLAIYGRGLMKVWHQLRDLIFSYLQDTYHDWEHREPDQFYRDFQRSVDVCVFASGYKACLLAEGPLHFQVFSGEFSSPSKIHELSLQFSQFLATSEVANTSFSFSARYKVLSERMISPKIDLPAGWGRTVIEYEGEKGYIFFRAWGNEAIKRISTLRLFPGRSEFLAPQITSFPIMGNISRDGLEELCKRGAKMARLVGAEKIEALLLETGIHLQSARLQLICFICSAIDFFNFCQDFFTPAEYEMLTCELTCDIRKTACNFGGGEELFQELLSIIFIEKVRKILEKIFVPELEKHVKSFIRLSPNEIAGLDIQEEGSELAKHCMESVAQHAYEVGISDTEQAIKISNMPYLFEPLKYQQICKHTTAAFSDGVLDPKIILAEPTYDTSDTDVSVHISVLIASFVIAMDRGLFGPIENVKQDGEAYFLAKVGELSTFYYPKRFFRFIPAFSLVEKFFFRQSDSKRKAIVTFVHWLHRKLPDLLSENGWEQLSEYIEQTYRCEQTFQDWNFLQLVGSESDPQAAALEDEAKKFLLLDRLNQA